MEHYQLENADEDSGLVYWFKVIRFCVGRATSLEEKQQIAALSTAKEPEQLSGHALRQRLFGIIRLVQGAPEEQREGRRASPPVHFL